MVRGFRVLIAGVASVSAFAVMAAAPAKAEVGPDRGRTHLAMEGIVR